MLQYSWKQKFFSSKTTIYQGNTAIGHFTIGAFMKGYMELLEQTYTIKKTGIWGNKYEVYKNEEKVPSARIIFHFWGSTATIEYNNKKYKMAYRSIFLTRFNLYHQDQSIYAYKSSSYKGKLTTEKEDPLLISLGIYCHVKIIMTN